MRSPLPLYLHALTTECSDGGELASYIPELTTVDPDRLGIALSTIDGTVYSTGDVDSPFTIQSISKVFVYAIALEDAGVAGVLAKVDVEPSGDPFNELSLDPETGRPSNPMINAGAITTHTLVRGINAEERFTRIADVLSRAAGRTLDVNESVFFSELATADRNRALAYMLHSTGTLEADPIDAVTGYTRQCALSVTARDLAVMAATLGNNGVQPVTGERIFSPEVVRQTLSVMFTCGMYDAAGDWVSSVGIPAKSGVGGGIIGALPGQLGIATFSPRLDPHGHSVNGVHLFQRLSADMGLHLMSPVLHAQNVLRRDERAVDLAGRPLRIFGVQGAIDFTAGELITRHLCDLEDEERSVVLDLRRVTSMNTVARLMVSQTIQWLTRADIVVTVVDPHGMLPAGETPAARRIESVFDLVPLGRQAKAGQVSEE